MFEGTTNVYFAGSKHFCALYKCFGAQDIFLHTIIYVYLILPHLDGHTLVWYRKTLAFLTLYDELSAARTPERFAAVRVRLQQEWIFNAGFVS